MEEYLKRYYDNHEDFYREMDHGYGNAAIEGYCMIAAKNAGLNDDQIFELRCKLDSAFDWYCAYAAAHIALEGFDAFSKDEE